MIEWQEEKDLHIKGSSSFGMLWIRLAKDRSVTGVYTLFGKTRKFIPIDEKWNIEEAKTVASLAIEDEILKRKRDSQIFSCQED